MDTRGMLHPSTEVRFVSEAIGVGVFVTEPIPKGTLTWVRCALDQRLSPAQVDALPPAYRPVLERYAYYDGQGHAVLCWDHARLMNHHCEPAVLSPGFDVDVAVRDLLPGDELTCHYGALNLTEPFRCACGSPRCRGVVEPFEGFRQVEAWDARLLEVFPRVAAVAQPLLPFAREAERILAASRGEVPVPSCRSHYRSPPEKP